MIEPTMSQCVRLSPDGAQRATATADPARQTASPATDTRRRQ
jgi:hypothetical protein